MDGSKFDTRGARIIASQLYVAKNLAKTPAKIIKFIKTNKDYFPSITPQILKQIQEEHGLTDEQIENETAMTFADIQAERKFEAGLKEKAEKINELRKVEKRDHRGRNGENPNVYVGREETDSTNTKYKELEQLLKELLHPNLTKTP